MYQALYRKWRPQTFDDVIGQRHVTDTLKSELRTGKLSHAYLFTGTRGTGKTTCAKILAKAVNCEHPVDGNPCNCCPACKGIDAGSVLDVLELDAASNNGVDNVRALRDEAIYTPGTVKMRVYIIDEVHMLSNAAFNALLKIMEEPPEHLLFILATTEVHKVPATILSRCQRFAFKRITQEDLAAHMANICEKEHIDATPEALSALSRLADGAARDALSLLDQCAAAGETVDLDRVYGVLGLAGSRTTQELLTHVAQRDTGSALTLLARLYEDGKDISAVFGELSTLVRDVMISVTTKKSEGLVTGTYDAATLDRFAARLPLSRLLYILDRLQETLMRLPLSTNQRIDAEMTLIALCNEQLQPDLKAFASRLNHLEMAMNGMSFSPPPQAEQPEELPPEPAPEREAPPPPQQSVNSESIDDVWPEMLALLQGELGKMEYAHLADTRSVIPSLQGSTIILSYDAPVCNSVLNRPEVKDAIRAAARHVLGRDVEIRMEFQKNSGNDRFSEIMKLGDKFKNVNYK